MFVTSTTQEHRKEPELRVGRCHNNDIANKYRYWCQKSHQTSLIQSVGCPGINEKHDARKDTVKMKISALNLWNMQKVFTKQTSLGWTQPTIRVSRDSLLVRKCIW